MGEEIDVDQEIECLEEEIGQDETVLETRDGTQFHRDRLKQNRLLLAEMIDLRSMQSLLEQQKLDSSEDHH